MPPPTIDELTLADEPGNWAALGFDVADAGCQIGAVSLRFAGRQAGVGIVAWSLRDAVSTDLDGLPTTISHAPVPASASAHPNGCDRDRPRGRGVAGPGSQRHGDAGRRPGPAPGARGADAGGRAAAGVLPPGQRDPRADPGAAGGDRARRRGRSPGAASGAWRCSWRISTSRARARRTRRVGSPGCATGPADRHACAVRRVWPCRSR